MYGKQNAKAGNHVKPFTDLSLLLLLSIACFAFVDDTNFPVIATNRSNSGEIAANKFQKALNNQTGRNSQCNWKRI